jgi:hypothetical protein
MNNSNASFYSFNGIVIIFFIVAAYLLVSFLLIGYNTDQLVLSVIFCTGYFASAISRKFMIAFVIFIVYWIIFDYMKAFPNYAYSPVSILQLHQAELSIFGIHQNGIVVTPNEFWFNHSTTFLDILSGIFYLCWIPLPLAFAAGLFFKDKKTFLQFSLTFLLVNLIGFVIYYIYPAAPPWYFQKYGSAFFANTPGNSAGLQRFDDYLDVGIFKSIYAKSSNVFAAMPSLHVAYPMIVLYYGIKKKMGWINVLFALVMAGIWFAAIYTGHHYVLDVVAGIACAIAGIFIFKKLILPAQPVQRFLQYYLSKI